MHSMWGARQWDDSGFSQPPGGSKLKVTPGELKEAFGLKPDPVVQGVEEAAEELWAGVGTGHAPRFGERAQRTRGARGRQAEGHAAHQRVKREHARLPPEGRPLNGQVLSPMGQEEMGVNPHGQACPSYGTDQPEFLVVGGTAHFWRKTVYIRSLEGETVGIIKRGCPAWTNSFVWKVLPNHAEGCRVGIDPSVWDEAETTCQQLETEVLYTDEFTGLMNSKRTRVMDCHDDNIFNVYEEKRDVIIHDFKIHSDSVIADANGTVMGYCRQDRSSGTAIRRVGDHNFTVVDLEGKAIASAVRPRHWENGATEHTWHVTIHEPMVPLTLSDARVVAVAVVNNVLLHEEDDWCSDIVWMLTPVLLTTAVIGIIAAISTCVSWFSYSNDNKRE